MFFTQETFSTIKIFISFADEDKSLMLELEKHLSPLVHSGIIAIFHRHKISPGADREKKISEQLASAHIILLLVSAYFIASDYCFSIELKQALERHEAGNVRIIPIILRPVIWKKTRLGRLQSLPRNGKPIIDWFNRDKAFFDVSCDIEKTIEEISSDKQIIL
jgi:hypothetical protein